MGVMFGDCHSLTSIDLTHFNTLKVTNIGTMFKNCYSLKEINLSSFDTKLIVYLDNLFNGCRSLTSINLSSFDTSAVIKTENMFRDCILLTSIDISNFNTRNLQNLNNMFSGCTSLISLDFPNIDLSKATSISNVFYNCNNLLYINFKNYIPSTKPSYYYFTQSPKNLVVCVQDNVLKGIIEEHECNTVNCSENWFMYRKKILDNGTCVDDCTQTDFKYEYNFSCYSNCLNGTYNNSFKCEECHQECSECLGPYNTNCTSCSSDDKFLKFGKCVDKEECIRGFYLDVNTYQNTCKCDLEQCHICSFESYNKHLCTKCEEGFYPIYDNNYEKNFPFLNCSKFIEGYYFNNSFYKPCYSSCKTCDIEGNEIENKCKECKYEFNYEINLGLYKNCYKNCVFYYYYEENKGKYYCTKNKECPKEYDKLIEYKKECVNDCVKDGDYRYEFRKYCYEKCPIDSTERNYNSTELDFFPFLNKKYFCKPLCTKDFPFEMILTQECVQNCPLGYILNKSCILNHIITKTETEKEKSLDIFVKNIEKGFTSENFDTTQIEKGNDEVIEMEKVKITLTTTQNQKNGENNINLTTINLGGCEDILRSVYNIPKNKFLYMIKKEVTLEGFSIPKIEFDIYSRLNNTYLTKLNLSHCNNSKVIISIPTTITESLDKLNSSSGFYNDICYTATSDTGTDIILKDRRKEFVEKNKTLCQENCVFKSYDYDNKKADCSCDIIESSDSIANININKTKLYQNFVDIKNLVNINLLVCYKVLFSKKGIEKNYGSILLMPIIFIHFILIVLFYVSNSYKRIEEKINEIAYGINNWNLVIAEEREKEKEKGKKEVIKKNEQINGRILKRKKEKEKKKEEINKKSKKIPLPFFLQFINMAGKNKKNKNNLPTQSNPPKKNNIIDIKNKNIKMNKSDNNIINNINIQKQKKNKRNVSSIRTINQQQSLSLINETKEILKKTKEIIDKTKEIMSYNDQELNNLEYKLALINDKRTFFQYYLSLLRAKHIIIFTFCNNNDYNSKIIKINLLLFNFVLSCAVNTLFFSDNTMHKIYEEKGAFNFIYQLPQIIYSSLISTVFDLLLKMLALSEGLILQFKGDKNKKNLERKIRKLNNGIKIKFMLYFILSSILILFFWYYISVFCSIYVNTQIHLIKDSLISFGLSLIFPFGINLIPGIFRIPSLSNINKNRSYLYIFSRIMQLI